MTAEIGLLALPLILWMMFLALKRGFSMAGRPEYAGITVGLISIFLHGLIDFNFHIPANMMLFVICVSFIMNELKK